MPQIYKTKDGTQTGFVPGVGEIVNGLLTVPDGIVIENANLEKIEPEKLEEPSQPQASAAPAAPAPSVSPAPSAPVPPANVPVTPPQTAPVIQPTPPVEQVNKEATNE